MEYKQMIKDVYYMAGMLEGLSTLQGLTITEGMAFVLADCVDRLELIGAQLLDKEVGCDGSKGKAFDIIP